jgi:hypothetical protein
MSSTSLRSEITQVTSAISLFVKTNKTGGSSKEILGFQDHVVRFLVRRKKETYYVDVTYYAPILLFANIDLSRVGESNNF